MNSCSPHTERGGGDGAVNEVTVLPEVWDKLVLNLIFLTPSEIGLVSGGKET